jgi:hypothetical protein
MTWESIKQAKKNNPFISWPYVFITFNTHHLGARCPVTGENRTLAVHCRENAPG